MKMTVEKPMYEINKPSQTRNGSIQDMMLHEQLGDSIQTMHLPNGFQVWEQTPKTLELISTNDEGMELRFELGLIEERFTVSWEQVEAITNAVLKRINKCRGFQE